MSRAGLVEGNERVGQLRAYARDLNGPEHMASLEQPGSKRVARHALQHDEVGASRTHDAAPRRQGRMVHA